jgi:NIMA (never in mitosis gene a)-related kinase
MDFADGGDLASMIKKHKSSLVKIQEETVWKAIHDMLLGLSHLHSMKILHRDLKPANIFSHGGTYKLGDLNVSKVNRGGLAYTQTGTPYYASPEVWRDDPYN